MARLARVVVPGFPHHVTQRGNGRARTFFSARDFALYRERLPVYRRSDLTVDIAPEEGPEEIAARIALRIGSRVT